MGSLYDELRIAAHAVWTRRWLALAVAWGVCLVGWLVVSQLPSKYESRARLFVQLRSVLPASVNGPNQQAQAQGDVDTIRQTLSSAVNLEKVVRGTDLAKTVASDRDVADRIAGLQQNIKVTAQQDNLFEIVTTSSSPKLAAAITQKLIDIFVEQNLSDDRQSNSQTLQFLDQQLQQRQRQLQDAEAKRADFQNRYLGALPGTGSVADRIGAARTQLSQVDADLAAAQSSAAAVAGQMAGTPRSVAGDGIAPGMGPARARLAAVQGQLADARARGYTEQHPDVIALKAQLAQATAAARGEPVGAAGGQPNPVYATLQSLQADRQATVAALSIRRRQLQSDLDALTAKIAGDPEVAAEQGQIDRDYQVLKDQYDQLLAQREQTSLQSQAATQVDATKFRVIDPPTVARTPTAPNRPLLLTGVLLVGLIAGIGGAFAMAQLQGTFPTAARLEKAAGMPVIGQIGEMLTQAEDEIRRKRLKWFAGAGAALGVAWIGLLGVEMLQRGLAA